MIEDDMEQFEQVFNQNGRSESVTSESFFGGLRDEGPAAGGFGMAKLREGTFVGTPLYVAPEMLEANMAGKFTDLWALGCMIYQFHVGQTPFHGKRQDIVFQNIKERNISFPSTMDKDA